MCFVFQSIKIIFFFSNGGDGAKELADAVNTAVELPPHMNAGVLVVDADEELYRVARGLVSGLCPVFYAADVEGALAVMHEHEIAVMLADVDAALDHLRSCGFTDDRIGVVGFCFGGRATFLVALRRGIIHLPQ